MPVARRGRPPVTEHGNSAYKHHGCRCGVCRAATREIQRKYQATEAGRASMLRGAKKYRDKRRDFINAAKDVPCLDCGVKYHPEAMDFDHRPGEVKMFNIGSLPRQARTIAVIESEIKKCDVVCATCHRLRTVSRRELR